MMRTLIYNRQKLFGLYELDDAGLVLYSRIEADGSESGVRAVADAAGQNYFDEVAPFENVDEFRLLIANFTRGHRLADSFNFTCRLDDGPLPVRVLLARIRERTNGEQLKSILVHIRKV
jgi:hypothetical protein